MCQIKHNTRVTITCYVSGYFYLVVEDDGSINTTMVHSTVARSAFMKSDNFPADDKVCDMFRIVLSGVIVWNFTRRTPRVLVRRIGLFSLWGGIWEWSEKMM